MLKAYKYRLYPSLDQAKLIDKTISYCRFVYNLALEIRTYAWNTQRQKVSIFNLCAQLTELKQVCPWLTEVDSNALQTSVQILDKSYSTFFKGGGFPKFKSKRKGTQSFQCRKGVRRINWEENVLTIPKIKKIPIVLSRKFDNEIKSVTISKTPTGKYYASVLFDDGLAIPAKGIITKESIMGIDVGITSYVITSSNLKFEPNRKLKENLTRLNCLKRRASKKVRGSNNRKKENKKIAKIYERITNQRLDYIHKTTHKLISDNQVNAFMVEDLNVTGMLKNRSLSLALSDVSFGEFFRQMKYKCEWHGKHLIQIDRFYPSSKTCSSCGLINDSLTLDNRTWSCDGCESIHDRDLNAAINIRNQGLKYTVYK